MACFFAVVHIGFLQKLYTFDEGDSSAFVVVGITDGTLEKEVVINVTASGGTAESKLTVC